MWLTDEQASKEADQWHACTRPVPTFALHANCRRFQSLRLATNLLLFVGAMAQYQALCKSRLGRECVADAGERNVEETGQCHACALTMRLRSRYANARRFKPCALQAVCCGRLPCSHSGSLQVLAGPWDMWLTVMERQKPTMSQCSTHAPPFALHANCPARVSSPASCLLVAGVPCSHSGSSASAGCGAICD
jgi:hypothetical protein